MKRSIISIVLFFFICSMVHAQKLQSTLPSAKTTQVLDALVYELHHGDEAQRSVQFDTAGIHNVRARFNYSGFGLSYVRVLQEFALAKSVPAYFIGGIGHE